MRVGRMMWADSTLDRFVTDVARAEQAGFAAAWTPQVFGWDALTALALAARATSRIELGTAVVPLHSRHPLALAASALTSATVAAGRFTLGVGTSHRFIVEDIWGYSYDRPLAYTRDYLAALLPALAGQPTDVATERVTARLARPLDTPGAAVPDVLLAAMGPRMLDLAATRCAGTITWLAGVGTLRDRIVPRLVEAAAAASRPTPRVVAGLPVCVTGDPRGARERAGEQFAVYRDVPAYRRVMDQEGAAGPSDVAIVGSKAQVADALGELAAAGATDLMAMVFGTAAEQDDTCELLTSLSREASGVLR